MRSAARTRVSALALFVLLLTTCVACGSGSDGAGPTPTTAAVLELGTPDPPLPTDINEVPFGIGQPAALGNLQVTMTRAVVSDERVSVQVAVRNGSLETIALPDDTFRLYLHDGSSIVMADDGTLVGQALESGATVDTEIAAAIPAGSTPSMVLVNGSSTDDRMLPGAFVLGTLTVESGED